MTNHTNSTTNSTTTDYERRNRAAYQDGVEDAELDLYNGTYWLPEWVDRNLPEHEAYAKGYETLKDEARRLNYEAPTD